jgi:5-formyltetrahydrofolate cyclo-ligase
MGGGFYDRTFAFKKTRCRAHPYLIGVGYSFQKLTSLNPQWWDVPMNIVIAG